MKRSDCCGAPVKNNTCTKCKRLCGSHEFIPGEESKPNKQFAEVVNNVFGSRTTNLAEMLKK